MEILTIFIQSFPGENAFDQDLIGIRYKYLKPVEIIKWRFGFEFRSDHIHLVILFLLGAILRSRFDSPIRFCSKTLNDARIKTEYLVVQNQGCLFELNETR